MASVQKRKLIEVALPLEAINKEAAREKSIRHGHPSTLHLWWARRPLAAARAVLFAQLVDDPSAQPDKFPTEEAQRAERERLHDLIKELVLWKNARNERVLRAARDEILKSTGGSPPVILDPFAGGGTIPLEAHRLGLDTRATDLNPVAVLISKALIEIPPKFRDRPPVHPGLVESEIRTWRGAAGIAADVRAYGAWMRDEAEKRIGHLYPKVGDMVPIAWIWARTVTCPNPACGIEMPLVRSWWLGRKKGREAYVVPEVIADSTRPTGKRIRFAIFRDGRGPRTDGTISGRHGATCAACNAAVGKEYIKAEGVAGRMSATLVAVVAEGSRRRVYLEATADQEAAAQVARPDHTPDEPLPRNSQYMGVPLYGMTTTASLFTNRQLVAVATLSRLVAEARERVLKDALTAGLPEGLSLESGGTGALAYADAVATYLGFAVSKFLARNNTMCTWEDGMDRLRGSFQRQAMGITWDFAEANPLEDFGGGFGSVVSSEAEVLESLYVSSSSGWVAQVPAQTADFDGVVSTDPPYYDNVPYADLSDFFYVWLRHMLRSVHPGVLSTILVPKAEELVANPARQGGHSSAKRFFEEGFRAVFSRARASAQEGYPITVYYAFRQSGTDDAGLSSSGWETLLEGMISSGWAITATWPMRTEGATRMRAAGSNALASSIVLALRPRPSEAQIIDRRGFIAALLAELPEALRRLQQGQIAPVDLPQAAIGPGMAVFSRFAAVIEDDGSRMSVRSALARINEILDQVLNEQEGDFDSATRFAIAWYRQHGYGIGKFGDADNLARARNTAVDALARDGILTSGGGKVALIRPAALKPTYDIAADKHVGVWEALHHLIRVLESSGVGAAGAMLAQAVSRPQGPVDGDLVKELAFLLFSIAEKNGWTKDALSFNALATSWADIVDASRGGHSEQLSLDYGSDE